MDKSTVIHIAVTTALIIGVALVLNERPLDTETVWDALALAFVITLLSLQAWVRRRTYPPKPPGADRPHPPGNRRFGPAM